MSNAIQMLLCVTWCNMVHISMEVGVATKMLLVNMIDTKLNKPMSTRGVSIGKAQIATLSDTLVIITFSIVMKYQFLLRRHQLPPQMKRKI